MSFLTGIIIIDTPASALNNSDEKIVNARTDNTTSVKYIHTRSGDYPYVSAQAIRAWLRNGLENVNGWKSSPVYRDAKIAYTAGDPISYDDDDIFGYMRAPGEGLEKRQTDPAYKRLTPLDIAKNKGKDQELAVTRIAPFRVSTFVSLAPVSVTVDYGNMARQESGSQVYPAGPDPVPYEHQFYHATLQGLVSLDLHRVGRFTYQDKTGYRNLDEARKKIASEKGMEHYEQENYYLLQLPERIRRIRAVLSAMAHLEGGAKLAVHYTDVSPDITFLAITKGGNNIFGHVVKANVRGLPEINIEALSETLRVYSEDLLSPVYVGWVKGYLDEQRDILEKWIKPIEINPQFNADQREEAGVHNQIVKNVRLMHPREAFKMLSDEFDNKDWLS